MMSDGEKALWRHATESLSDVDHEVDMTPVSIIVDGDLEVPADLLEALERNCVTGVITPLQVSQALNFYDRLRLSGNAGVELADLQARSEELGDNQRLVTLSFPSSDDSTLEP